MSKNLSVGYYQEKQRKPSKKSSGKVSGSS